jgi:peroxiredoxin
MHAVQLGLVAPKLAALDATLMIVLPEPMARAQKVAKLIRATFPVLADPDRHVFRSFGFGRKLLFIQQSGTAVVGRDGWIAYARRSISPRGALDMPELMRALERLGGTPEEFPS